MCTEKAYNLSTRTKFMYRKYVQGTGNQVRGTGIQVRTSRIRVRQKLQLPGSERIVRRAYYLQSAARELTAWIAAVSMPALSMIVMEVARPEWLDRWTLPSGLTLETWARTYSMGSCLAAFATVLEMELCPRLASWYHCAVAAQPTCEQCGYPHKLRQL
jgi:hypothetical protein